MFPAALIPSLGLGSLSVTLDTDWGRPAGVFEKDSHSRTLTYRQERPMRTPFANTLS